MYPMIDTGGGYPQRNCHGGHAGRKGGSFRGRGCLYPFGVLEAGGLL